MKLFEKVKNMFTEEIEEEKPIKKEIRHVEIPTPKPIEEKPVVEEKKEEKLLFFDDKDFEDLEKEEEKVFKPLPKKEEPLPYKGAKPTTVEEPKKVFKPSPIISPVYGVLDKNYHKEDIVSKKTTRSSYHSENITVDDVRERAFSTLEDDLKNEILEDDYITSKREVVEDDLDIFKDIDEEETSINEPKEEIIEKESLEDDLLDDTTYLAQKLEEQKKKLDEINNIINENVSPRRAKNIDEYLYREQEEKEKTTENPKEIPEEEKAEEPEIEKQPVLEKTLEKTSEKIEKPSVEEQNTEEMPKSLDEAYKDAFDDIEEASNKTEPKKTKTTKKKDMSDSELLNLIDSMYEKSDEHE